MIIPMNIIPKLYKLSYSLPSLLHSRPLPPISLFSTTKPLPSTQFSKQLGLQTQLQKFINQQQKHQNSTYRTSAIMVIGLLTAVGTYAIVQLVDSELQLIRLYNVTKAYLKLKYLGKENKVQVLRQLEDRYVNGLYQYYEKNYKDRSNVDVWFVRRVIGLIAQSSQVNNGLILNLVTLLADKLQSSTRSASVILELVQTMVHKSKRLPQNQALLTNLCTRLLKHGNLNQQYLGLVTLSKTTPRTHLHQLLTPNDIQHQTMHTLLANKTAIQHQLKPASPTQPHEQSQLQIKITTVKQKLLYQIDELKLCHQIKMNKVNLIGEFLEEVAKEGK